MIYNQAGDIGAGENVYEKKVETIFIFGTLVAFFSFKYKN
jgi:hypothetical protein